MPRAETIFLTSGRQGKMPQLEETEYNVGRGRRWIPNLSRVGGREAMLNGSVIELEKGPEMN